MFHIFWSMLAMFVFIGVTLPITFALYEPRPSSNSILAKSNSYGDVTILLTKICLQLSFDAFNSQWALVIVLVITGACCFAANVLNRAHYDQRIRTIILTWNLVFFWSSLIILFLAIISSTGYEGGFIVWATGVIFIAAMGSGISHESYKSLSKDASKSSKESVYAHHLLNLLILVRISKENEKAFLTLVSYCQNHKDNCSEIDCPLNSVSETDSGFINPFLNQPQVLVMIKRLFLLGIKRYRSLQLRIDYAAFLIEYMHSNKEALEELDSAQSMNPTLIQQFQIYRQRKLIEEGSDSGNKGTSREEYQLDLVGMIALESHIKGCVQSIRALATVNCHFWEELLQDGPSLTVLFQNGRRMKELGHSAEDNWKKLDHIAGNHIVVMKLFARYQEKVCNQQKKAEHIIQQFEKKVRSIIRAKNKDYSDIEKANVMQTVCVSVFDQKESGQLIKVNKSFELMFQGTMENYKSKLLKDLLPPLYLSRENRPERAWFQHLKTFSDYLGNEKSYFTVSFVGSLRQTAVKTVSLPLVDMNEKSSLFLSVFRHEKPLDHSAIFLASQIGVITSYSMNCCLYLPQVIIHEGHTMLSSILPGAIEEGSLRNKSGPFTIKSDNEKKTLHVCVKTHFSRVLYNGKKNLFRFPEDQNLIGFSVHMNSKTDEMLNSLEIEMPSRRYMRNRSSRSKTKFIWNYIDRSFDLKLPNQTEILIEKPSDDYLTKDFQTVETTSRRINFADKIITRRLHNKKLTEVLAEQEVDGKANRVSHLPLDPEKGKSVFQKTLTKHDENDRNVKTIFKANIIELVYERQARKANGLVPMIAAFLLLSVQIITIILALTVRIDQISYFRSRNEHFFLSLDLQVKFSQLANLLLDKNMIDHPNYSPQLQQKYLETIPDLKQTVLETESLLRRFFLAFNGTTVAIQTFRTMDLLSYDQVETLYSYLNVKRNTKDQMDTRNSPLTNLFLFSTENVSMNTKDLASYSIMDFRISLTTTLVTLFQEVFDMTNQPRQINFELTSFGIFNRRLTGMNNLIRSYYESLCEMTSGPFLPNTIIFAICAITFVASLAYFITYLKARQSCKSQAAKILSLFLDIPRPTVKQLSGRANDFEKFCQVI